MPSHSLLSMLLATVIGASTLGCGSLEPAESTPEQIEKSRQEHIERSRRELQES